VQLFWFVIQINLGQRKKNFFSQEIREARHRNVTEDMCVCVCVGRGGNFSIYVAKAGITETNSKVSIAKLKFGCHGSPLATLLARH